MHTATARYKIVDGDVWLSGAPNEGNIVLSADKYGVDVTDPGLMDVCGEKALFTVFPGRPDILFAAGENVVWVEWKNLDDLDSSIRSKRLARELRTGLDMADIVVLAVWVGAATYIESSLRMEMLRLQFDGIKVLCPVSRTVSYWDEVREVLRSPSNQRRAIAGTDDRKPNSALRGVPGVGAKTEAKLLKFYGNAHLALIAYGSDGWDHVLGPAQASRIEKVCRVQTG